MIHLTLGCVIPRQSSVIQTIHHNVSLKCEDALKAVAAFARKNRSIIGEDIKKSKVAHISMLLLVVKTQAFSILIIMLITLLFSFKKLLFYSNELSCLL